MTFIPGLSMSCSNHFPEQPELYRLILDSALDAFIVIDMNGIIIQWSQVAERLFGWTKKEALGLNLSDTVIPMQHHEAHLAGLQFFFQKNEHPLIGHPIEMSARRKDGVEIPVELTITPIRKDGQLYFSAAIRETAHRKSLEDEIRRQADITRSIVDRMADAVAVANNDGHIVMLNPAAKRLLDITWPDALSDLSFPHHVLYQSDRCTLFPDAEQPMTRALKGEEVNSMIAYIRHAHLPDGVWVSINARPLLDEQGTTIGGALVFHDVTQLREREEMLQSQAMRLQEQAGLLDLTHDAVLVRDAGDYITYFNRSACRLYGYSRNEALGQCSHHLLKTKFPVPLDQIRESLAKKQYWAGQLIHQTKDGREVIVFSQWAVDARNGQAVRYLETNTDITQRIRAERAYRQTQESYRLLVETSTEFAIITTDPAGIIETWNLGAEKILGIAMEDAIGQPVSNIFTPEDRSFGQPWQELEEARENGRVEDIRWHLRKDGSRFWANGVVMPLWNDDGGLRGFVKMLRDQTSQRLAEEQNQFFANHDMLTGLPNRVQLSNQLHKAIISSQRTQVPLSVLLLDLDRFKDANDTYGHHVGDLLLKEVAQRILSSIRESDIVARLGGDEFVVVQADAAQPEAAQILARKLIAKLGEPYRLDGKEINTGTSIGISTHPRDGNNAVELLKKADLALYRAKNAGRGTFTMYASTLTHEKDWQTTRIEALRNAIKNDELQLYYQPQVDLGEWKISTVEALLRWRVADVELALPEDFLDFAEESGLIVDIGDWALRESCRQIRHWQEKGLVDLRVSVNCSAKQFSDPAFIGRIGPILSEHGLNADRLELEVRESMLSTQPGIETQLAALRALGVRIMIDNYGTGANALINLKEIEVDGLKIDRRFVQHLPHRRKDTAVTSAIISLAHDLGISVSAGGVETAEQLAYLKARDCTSAQGFLFTPPVPAAKIEEIMFSDQWSRINRTSTASNGLAPDDLH